MLQGECDVRLGDRHMKILPGQTLVIPQGIRHEVGNSGWEPVVYVCAFSASTPGTPFYDPSVPGARPTVRQKPAQPWSVVGSQPMGPVYDLVVIGAGPAGEKGAAQAATRQARRDRRCQPRPRWIAVSIAGIPTKTLREGAIYLSGLGQSASQLPAPSARDPWGVADGAQGRGLGVHDQDRRAQPDAPRGLQRIRGRARLLLRPARRGGDSEAGERGRAPGRGGAARLRVAPASPSRACRSAIRTCTTWSSPPGASSGLRNPCSSSAVDRSRASTRRSSEPSGRA